MKNFELAEHLTEAMGSEHLLEEVLRALSDTTMNEVLVWIDSLYGYGYAEKNED